MGFQKRWDKTNIEQQLRSMFTEVNSPYNDGFVQWAIKKDLLDIKFMLDEIVATSPSFSGEKEYLEEQAKQQTWKILNE